MSLDLYLPALPTIAADLQAGAGRGEGNDIVALDRRRAERLRFETVD